jgi:hypothetical protein
MIAGKKQVKGGMALDPAGKCRQMLCVHMKYMYLIDCCSKFASFAEFN